MFMYDFIILMFVNKFGIFKMFKLFNIWVVLYWKIKFKVNGSLFSIIVVIFRIIDNLDYLNNCFNIKVIYIILLLYIC